MTTVSRHHVLRGFSLSAGIITAAVSANGLARVCAKLKNNFHGALKNPLVAQGRLLVSPPRVIDGGDLDQYVLSSRQYERHIVMRTVSSSSSPQIRSWARGYSCQ